MDGEHDPKEAAKAEAGAGYVIGQLVRALETSVSHADPAARERALQKISRWRQVLEGMRTGSLDIGARAPVEGIPAWVTLEVAHGGFATGNLMAEGELQPHEISLLERLPGDSVPHGRERAALNVYYLSEPGQRELRHMLETGEYRVHIPEEGALLAVTWLLSRNLEARAQELLDVIMPFFDRLRFYPAPDPTPALPTPDVKRQTTGEIAREIERYLMSGQMTKMLEALKIWQPMYDRAVALMLETTIDTVEGEMPCRRFPGDWKSRAQKLLDDYTELRAVHKKCDKPDRPKENFARLRGYIKTCIEAPAQLTARDTGMVRKILRDYTARHGAFGSEEFKKRRAAQSYIAAQPTHEDLNEVLIDRLRRLPHDSGLPDPSVMAAPVTAEEAARFGVPEGAKMPKSRVRPVGRCLEAPVEQLVEKGVIPSCEVLAVVLPQITSHVRASGIADPALRRLYTAIYTAFRRRRSLLLLKLDSQVRIDELPWVAAFAGERSDDLDAREAARQSLEQLSLLALVSFPQTILPNKMLQEFRALSSSAKIPIPLVDELAADIFQGTFTAKFLDAAQIAATLLHGTLYARYFGIPYEQVQRMLPVKHGEVSTAPELAALCERLTVAGPARSVVRNGTIIEQSQIVTTQNLAPLVARLDLKPQLEARLQSLAENCFRWIRQRQGMPPKTWRAELKNIKNCAYAWRQLLFFLSLIQNKDAASGFIAWARGYLLEQPEQVQQRLTALLDGLAWIAAGGAFDEKGRGGAAGELRRFVGWTTERHWILGPAKPSGEADSA